MKILITGICGYLGSALVRYWREAGASHVFYGIDNLSRQGSDTNRLFLKKVGVKMFHGDVRLASDFENLPAVDWVIDAAAQASVLSGTDGKTSSRQLVEHNLIGTVNILEYCKENRSGFILMSTSRVYSIIPLASFPMSVVKGAFEPKASMHWPIGLGESGLTEDFSTHSPISLYGATKLAAETLALEYAATFNIPIWINRCGVLAGAGQFGHAEQGVFSYWIHSWAQKKPLKYIGFGGRGYQVRDLLHPADLLPLLDHEMTDDKPSGPRIFNLGGGVENSISLAQLSEWCQNRFGPLDLDTEPSERPFDVPWLVLDCSRAKRHWHWTVERNIGLVFNEIADFAIHNPHWLDISSPS